MIDIIRSLTSYLPLTLAASEFLCLLLGLTFACTAAWARNPQLRRRAEYGLKILIPLCRSRWAPSIRFHRSPGPCQSLFAGCGVCYHLDS
jgi:hypothetical protein